MKMDPGSGPGFHISCELVSGHGGDADGTAVKAGSPLFYSKNYEGMNFVSPVSGTVREVVRGERRKVMSILIDADVEADTDMEFDTEQSKWIELIKEHLIENLTI